MEGSNFNLLSFSIQTIEPKSVKKYLCTIIDPYSIYGNIFSSTWDVRIIFFDLGCENYFSLTWDVKIIQPHRSNTCSWIAMGAKKGNQRAVHFDWKGENYATAMGLELSNSWDTDKSIRRGICIIWGLKIRYEDEIWNGNIVSGTFIQSATKMPAAPVWIVCLSMRAGRREGGVLE